jgi:hypothetical protein
MFLASHIREYIRTWYSCSILPRNVGRAAITHALRQLLDFEINSAQRQQIYSWSIVEFRNGKRINMPLYLLLNFSNIAFLQNCLYVAESLIYG